ncbi:MAG: GNAT family N-acetyltransferase [Elusimicrobiota bacterium]
MTELKLVKLDSRRMGDFERLHSGKEFGGCFCAVWSSYGEDWEERCSKERRLENLEHTRSRVRRGTHVGFLAYRETDGAVVGWTGAGPKTSFPLLKEKPGSRAGAFDDSVWAIACLAIPFAYRSLGYARTMIELVVEQARAAGAKSIEAYPVDPSDDESAYRGTRKLYEALGFSVADSELLPMPAPEPEPERPAAEPAVAQAPDAVPEGSLHGDASAPAEACVSAGAVASALSAMNAAAPNDNATPEAQAQPVVETPAPPSPAPEAKPAEPASVPVKAAPAPAVQRIALRMVKTLA